ncbi:O-methyltransferase [Thioalkalivibrio paradoxus]|uniref:SAM-dependent methyltransferase n=1 Tax=Thioalkalivibrio paradoxus ARh 1 TaxID=713585 RepID=W0DQ07_9GAMM|nr:class I SAM-dependent methyltransferase [Thioalkalivibrio paradoxus]AHE98960.1 SAM-dependent methyltransferase [Thioalkalivibrio paradoxus ARh 1]
MSNRSIGLNDAIYQYLLQVSLREHPVLAALRERTADLPEARFQIAPEQGQFMAWLAGAVGARRILEIGTFTGYSALTMALALPDDGELVTCDVSSEWTDIAREYWERAGVAARIRLELRPALETLERLCAQGESGRFDLAFIDADKTAYDDYFERCLELVRPGGSVLIDNTLWSGQVADPSVEDPATEAIRGLNRKLHRDERIDLSLVPIGDGLTLARKR